MSDRPGYYWVLLPYVIVFAGIQILHNAWGALIGFHLALLPVIAMKRESILPALRVTFSMRLLILSCLTGLFAGVGLWILWPYTGLVENFPLRIASLGISGFIWLPFVVYFTLVNPVLEEIYWRIVFGNPSSHFALVDLLFAGYHMIILVLFVNINWMILAFTILVFASWFWRQIIRSTRSVLPAVFAHALADFSLLVVLINFSQ